MLKEFGIGNSPLLELSSPLLVLSPTSTGGNWDLGNAVLLEITPTKAEIIFLSPGDDDDSEDGEGDWSDIDDEDFEDMAEDRDDFNEMELENDIFDPDDDDHLPDDDLQ